MELDRKPALTRFLVGTRSSIRAKGSGVPGYAFALIGILYFGFVIVAVVARGGVPVRAGWTAKLIGGSYTVTEVEAKQSEVLQPGDRLIAVSGDDTAGFFGPALALSRTAYGSFYPVRVRRGHRVLIASLLLNSGPKAKWNDLAPSLFVPFLLYLMATYIAAVKWQDLTARLAAMSFALAAFSMASVTVTEYPGWNLQTSALAILAAGLYRPLGMSVAYDFCSRFPRPTGETVAERALRAGLYAGAALLWIPLNVPVLAHISGVQPSSLLGALLPFSADGHVGALLLAGYEAIAGGLTCSVLVRNYRRLGDPDSRRKIRWAGLCIGVSAAVFLLFTILKFTWYLTANSKVLQWTSLINNAGVLVVALTWIGLAYAVVKHRVLGIHVVLRAGVEYLLAKNLLRLIVALPLLLLFAMAVSNPNRSLNDLLLHGSWLWYLTIAATGALSLRYRGQMRLWVDQKFFRESLQQEQTLAVLTERLKTAESEDELCLIAGRELETALHAGGCHILLQTGDGVIRVAYSQDPERAGQFVDWLDHDGAAHLAAGAPFSVCAFDASCQPDGKEEPEPIEYLMIPFTGTEARVAGTVALGPKRSEQPYTSRDRVLLKTIGGQMGIMDEVVRLKRRVEQESFTRVRVLGHLDNQRIQLLSECPECGCCYTTAESVCAHDGVPLTLTLPIERTVEGKYRLERRIGRGGMGVVYQAQDLRLNRLVAIKMMVGDLFGNTAAMARFEREARAAAGLNHPNIVEVHDFGRLPSGGAYLVMELVNGRSWREHLKTRCGLTDFPPEYLGQLCLAVEAAHAGGIIHRDLKPENLMIAEQGERRRLIVLDFGLAKMRAELSGPDKDLTLPGAVMGTRGYMSPEQRAGRKVDARTDVFSVGVICTETLTGRRPSNSGASVKWLKSSLSSGTTLPMRLKRLLERALAEHPAERPSMREFREELSEVLASLAPTPDIGMPRSETMDTLTMPPQDLEDGRSR